MTEHDANLLSDGGLGWIDDELDPYDPTLASSMDWIWKPGVITRDDAGAVLYVDDGGVYARLTRPYAMAIGGDLDATAWDGAALTVTFNDHPGVPSTHVYWNLRTTPAVTFDGRPVTGVTADPTRLIFSVACGGGDPPRRRGAHARVRVQFLVDERAPRVRRIHGDEGLHWHAMGLVPLGSAPPGAATQS